jgi:hypothetical protein
LEKGQRFKSGKFRCQYCNSGKFRCQYCNCLFEIESADVPGLKLVFDARDGDFFEVNCPDSDCGILNAIAADLLRAKPTL